MANTIEITKDFPASRERTVLLELLNVMKTLKQAQIEVVICGGWVPFLKELARHSQTDHTMSLDIDLLLRARARERETIDRIKDLLSDESARSGAARCERSTRGSPGKVDTTAHLTLTTRGSWAHERKLGVALACAPFFVTKVKRPLAGGIHDCGYGT
jgi:hypothetical protein